jgi:hypothetical protein
MVKRRWHNFPAVPALAACAVGVYGLALAHDDDPPLTHYDKKIDKHAQRLLSAGRQIFRFDTFGDEAFWGDTIGLHDAIQGEDLGGVGPGVSPGPRWRSDFGLLLTEQEKSDLIEFLKSL